jgi:NADPH2:quinone reductase
MRVIRIRGNTGVDSLTLAQSPEPQPGPHDVLVRVMASALNRADLLQAMGRYPAPPDAPQDIPGLEYAGEVVGAGPRAKRFAVGTHVMGIVGGGAFAELLTVHERLAMPAPASLPLDHAAAIPEAFLTGYDALVLQGGLRPNDWALIHAVGSGVGTAAAQLAHAWRARVVGTARTQAKLDRARELGLHQGILVDHEPRFAEQVRATAGAGIDVAIDLVGGAYVPETLACMAPRGRVLIVGTLAGNAAQLPLSVLMHSRLTVIGTVLRHRALEEKAALARSFEHAALPWFDDGTLKPVVDTVLPMEDLRPAAERMKANDSFGKIVLRWT